MARKKPEEQPMTNKQAITVLARQAREAADRGDKKYENTAHKVINTLLDQDDEQPKR